MHSVRLEPETLSLELMSVPMLFVSGKEQVSSEK